MKPRYYWQTGDIAAKVKALVEIWSVPVTETGCWIWLGTLHPNGYAQWPASVSGTKLGHRIVYEAFKGLISQDNVGHLCAVRCCINPTHLKSMTILENQQQKALDGNSPKGESNPKAKLTKEDVLKIRDLAKSISGFTGYKMIADLFKINECTVYDIVKNRTWRHI